MIDWYTIEYLYPESFKKFTKTMFPNVGVISTSTLEYYDIKKLFHFFDKEGVFLNIENFNKYQWVFSISLQNGVGFGYNQITEESREKIEIQGFNECFRLLDNKIRFNPYEL